MLYFALCIILACGLISLRLLREGLSSPAMIWVASLLLCCAAAFAGQFLWDNLPLGIDAFLIIVAAALVFATASVLVSTLLLKPRTATARNCLSCEPPLPLWFLGAVGMLAIATFIIYSNDVQAIVRSYGSESTGLMQAIGSYREFTIQEARGLVGNDYGKISVVASVMFRALEVALVVVSYNFIFMSSEDRKRYWVPFGLVILVSCGSMFLSSGSRSPIVHFAIAVIVLVAFSYDRSGKSVKLGVVFRWLGIAVLVLALFSFASVVRGEEMRLGLLGYLSFFLGSGLTSLNHMLSDQLLQQAPDVFSALTSMLSKVVELPQGDSSAPLWIDYLGYSSNVFTGFSGFFAHSGFLGVIGYCGTLGIVFALLYTQAANSSAPAFVMAYGFFAYVLFDVIRADAISSLIGVPLIEYVLLIAIMSWAYRVLMGSRKTEEREDGPLQ